MRIPISFYFYNRLIEVGDIDHFFIIDMEIDHTWWDNSPPCGVEAKATFAVGTGKALRD